MLRGLVHIYSLYAIGTRPPTAPPPSARSDGASDTGHNAATFDTLELALLAAEAGQGVALGDRDLVQDAIKAGRLAAPFDLALDQGLAYYLIYPAHRGQLGKIRTLRGFLVEVVGAQAGTDPS